jgi:hypothetical protein
MGRIEALFSQYGLKAGRPTAAGAEAHAAPSGAR